MKRYNSPQTFEVPGLSFGPCDQGCPGRTQPSESILTEVRCFSPKNIQTFKHLGSAEEIRLVVRS